MTQNWQRKVRPGDTLAVSAAAYNKFVDAAIANEVGRERREPWQHNLLGSHVQAVNAGTVSCKEGACVVLGASVEESLRERKRRLMLSFDPEDDGDDRTGQCLGVVQTACEPNQVVSVCVAGATLARCRRVSSSSPLLAGQRLDRRAGTEPVLVKNESGAVQMLGTGFVTAGGVNGVDELAVVRLGGTSGEASFLARITSATQIVSSIKRWSYGFAEVEWDTVTSKFIDLSGGRTGSAYNTLENGNSTTLAYGIALDAANGYAIHDTDGQYDFLSVPTNTVVRVRSILGGTSTTVFVFDAPNRIDGTCA